MNFRLSYFSLYFQALQLGQDSYSSFEQRSQRCQMCLRSDSLHKVMERLANPGEFILLFCKKKLTISSSFK